MLWRHFVATVFPTANPCSSSDWSLLSTAETFLSWCAVVSRRMTPPPFTGHEGSMNGSMRMKIIRCVHMLSIRSQPHICGNFERCVRQRSRSANMKTLIEGICFGRSVFKLQDRSRHVQDRGWRHIEGVLEACSGATTY